MFPRSWPGSSAAAVRSTAVRRVAVMAVVALGALCAGCSGDDGAGSTGETTGPPPTVADDTDRDVPLVGLVRPAVEALEDELGGPQDYFEINADARLVNLFVATDDATTVTAYVYLDGELGPPAPPREVSAGHTFGANALDFDPVNVLASVTDELPGSSLDRFVVVGTAAGTARYEVLVRSQQGGALAVEVALDGRVLSVETL